AVPAWEQDAPAMRGRLSSFGFSQLADRDGVDHALHGAAVLRVAEYEEEFVGFLSCELAGIDVFQNVGAAMRPQDLVHLEDTGVLLEGNCFDSPGVGADGYYALGDEVFCAFTAKTRFARAVALVVLADQVDPTGIEQHDVAFLDLDTLLLGDCVDLR